MQNVPVAICMGCSRGFPKTALAVIPNHHVSMRVLSPLHILRRQMIVNPAMWPMAGMLFPRLIIVRSAVPVIVVIMESSQRVKNPAIFQPAQAVTPVIAVMPGHPQVIMPSLYRPVLPAIMAGKQKVRVEAT